MRTLLIDPGARTVEAVDLDPTNLDGVLEVLRCKTLGLAKAPIGPDRTWHFLRVDDTGALTRKAWFRIPGYGGQLHGRALLYGITPGDMDYAPASVGPNTLLAEVQWGTRSLADLPAHAPLGTRVRTLSRYVGVPMHTEGVVDQHYHAYNANGIGMMIAWDLPQRPLPAGYREYDGRPAIAPDAPVRDGFSGRELAQLEIVE